MYRIDLQKIESVMWKAIMAKPTECSWNGPRRKQLKIKWTIWKLSAYTKMGVNEQNNQNNYGIENSIFFWNRGICESLSAHHVALAGDKNVGVSALVGRWSQDTREGEEEGVKQKEIANKKNVLMVSTINSWVRTTRCRRPQNNSTIKRSTGAAGTDSHSPQWGRPRGTDSAGRQPRARLALDTACRKARGKSRFSGGKLQASREPSASTGKFRWT